jgi:hypothetical protein
VSQPGVSVCDTVYGAPGLVGMVRRGPLAFSLRTNTELSLREDEAGIHAKDIFLKLIRSGLGVAGTGKHPTGRFGSREGRLLWVKIPHRSEGSDNWEMRSVEILDARAPSFAE